MTGAKIALISAIGVASVDPVTVSVVDTYKEIGVVGLLIIALAVLWRDSKKREAKEDRREEELTKVISENTKALQSSTDCQSTNTQLMVEVKDALVACKNRNR